METEGGEKMKNSLHGSTYKYGNAYLSIWNDGSFSVMMMGCVVSSGSAGSYNSPDVQNNPKTYHLPDNSPIFL
jgi:hypothetical protein